MPTATFTRIPAAFTLALAACAGTHAQDLVPKAPPQTQPVAIVNATVHPISGPPLERAGVVFIDGRIRAVGDITVPRDEEWRVIDAAGLHIYPGLIGAYTQVGLREIAAVRASTDTNETGGVTPEAIAAVSVNPDSTIIPVTRHNGVLTVGVFPQGGPIAGRASVMRMDGWTWEDMTVRADAGLIVAWPLMRPVRAWWMDRSDEDQRRDIERNVRAIEEAFDAARAYITAKDAEPNLPTDIRWEAMRGVLTPGPDQTPVFFEANEYDQIAAVVAFSGRYNLRAVVVGGRDAELAAGLLREADIPVIVNGTTRFPKRDDSPYDEAFTLPARLQAAGVRWCLASGQETPHERNLPYSAALAAAYGLDPDTALRAITLSAAEVLGVADRLGSLEPGKAATLIITDGNPLEVTSNVLGAFIDGREIALTSKQLELERKYRERYRQTGDLRAPAP